MIGKLIFFTITTILLPKCIPYHHVVNLKYTFKNVIKNLKNFNIELPSPGYQLKKYAYLWCFRYLKSELFFYHYIYFPSTLGSS